MELERRRVLPPVPGTCRWNLRSNHDSLFEHRRELAVQAYGPVLSAAGFASVKPISGTFARTVS